MCKLKLIMEFKKPKPKKHFAAFKKFDFPVKNNKQVIGLFTGFNVVISDWESMKRVYQEGNFGKGSLSKGMPVYHIKKDDLPRIVYEQQLENQSKWNTSVHYSCLEKYIGDAKKDLELSEISVKNFMESSFCDSEETWESWKKNNGQDLKNDSRNNNAKYVSQLLTPSASINDYTDEHFCKLVNKLLQSKHNKKFKYSSQKAEEKVIVISKDSIVADKPLCDLKVKLETIPYIAEENLHLGLEESFFLKFVTGCLSIVDLNLKELNICELWQKFNKTQKHFIERYVAYHYYRSKGWVVKSGLKFGGDYLLYKDGPAFFHGSYLIQVLNEGKKLSWREFIGVNRMVETFNKDLVWCNVMVPSNISKEEWCPNQLKNCSVQEVLTRRWFPSKERLTKDDS